MLLNITKQRFPRTALCVVQKLFLSKLSKLGTTLAFYLLLGHFFLWLHPRWKNLFNYAVWNCYSRVDIPLLPLDSLSPLTNIHANSSFNISRITMLWVPWLQPEESKKPATRSDATADFPAKWRLKKELRNSILITCHYPDLSAFHWMK